MKLLINYGGQIVLMTIFTSIFSLGFGQSTMLSKKDNDPKAKQILDKLKKQYDSYKTMEVSFELDLELVGRPSEKQTGVFIQDGKKFQIKMQDQEIYTDAKSVWLYQKRNKEVQISDFDENETNEIMSPKQMMNLYNRGDFIYAILEERKSGGAFLADIEFKPINKNSDYTKMRLTVNKNANKMVSLRVFSRDGSKYTLKITNLKYNKKYEPAMFSFNPKAVTGIHIEDLRMD